MGNKRRKNFGGDKQKKASKQASERAEDEEEGVEDATVCNEENNNDEVKPYALFITYCGLPFNGIQIQNGSGSKVITIESIIYDALSELNLFKSKILKEIKLQRACRTDRGVSAIRNVISFRLSIPEIKSNTTVSESYNILESLRMKMNEQINKHPKMTKYQDYIQVTQIQRIPGMFKLHHYCHHRRYLYILPHSTLDLESKNILLKSNNIFNLNTIEEKMNKLNELFSKYEGTHFFHNFTIDVNPGAETAVRQIKSMKIIENNDDHFVIEIVGRSFMLHQIRIMIGTCVSMIRGLCPADMIETAFKPNIHVDLPLIMPEGLFLDICDFPNYNRNIVKPPFEALSLKEDKIELVEKFKNDFLIPKIVQLMKEQNIALKWLVDLHCSKGSYFKPVEYNKPNNNNNQKKTTKTVETATTISIDNKEEK
ncbi:hypothetical protein ABK040_003114 [Willaertia magna]